MPRIYANGLVLVLLLSSCTRYGYQEGDDRKAIVPFDSGPGESRTLDRGAVGGQDLGLDGATDRGNQHPEFKVDDLGSADASMSEDSTPEDQLVAPDSPLTPDLPLSPDAPMLHDLSLPDIMVLPDLPVIKPDTTQPDDMDQLPACPAGMITFSDYCINSNEGTLQPWVNAAEDCMSQGKRLCSVDEWTTACNSGDAGLLDMTGNDEWINKLFSDTEAKKAGSSSCGSISHHEVTSGLYATRCCLSRIKDPPGMFFISDGGTYIDPDQGPTNTWVRAANTCMSLGKRLCHELEWTHACNAGTPFVNDMVGDYEWLMTLKSTTNAYKAGSSSCSDISNHNFLQDPYRTRCCF